MKNVFVLSTLVICGLFSACNKVAQLANINVDIPYSQQFSVPQVPGDTAGFALPNGGLSLPFPAVPFATNSQQYISQYNTAIDKITDVDLKSLSLQITSPATQNFDFIDSIELYIAAPSQPEVLVGYQYSIPKGTTTLNLNTLTTLNLENYFIQDSIYFYITTHINAIPASGTQLSLNSIFNFQANPLN